MFGPNGKDFAELEPQDAADVVINKKDITNAEITLGETLTYTGSELTRDFTVALLDGIEIDYNIPEEELNGMDVKGYFVKGGWLTLELGESIAEFE